MNTIYFATSNKEKVISTQNFLAKYNIKLKQIDLNITEPQDDTVEKVASSKAKQAFRLIKKPVIAVDGGLFIDALNGFPGPYAKYITETIKIEGLLKLLDKVDNRQASFVNAVAFCWDKDKVEVFSEKRKGKISLKPKTGGHNNAWSSLWNIFIPLNSTKTLSEMSNKERRARDKQKRYYDKFGEWYLKYIKKPVGFR